MRLLVASLALAAAGAGCAGTVTSAVVVDMERTRTAPDVVDAARFAPQEFALAENERAASQKAAHDGDAVAAGIYAGQATASYSDAVVLARLARATRLADDANADLARDDARAQKLAGERTEAEREADELDKKLQIARELLAPAPSGPADPAREAARLVAARALAAQARLLCGAARLLSPALEGLDAASKDVVDLEAQLDKGRPPPAPKGKAAVAAIDAAARVRANCLGILTRARRGGDAAGPGGSSGTSGTSARTEPDVLLSELSATVQFAPVRDERGVVVVLRDAWKGVALAPQAASQLAELGRVAGAHPEFAVQVVVHDATPPTPAEAAADQKRAEAAAAALVAAGAAAARVKAEAVGALAPLVDPHDLQHRARNARLEVVFVSPG